MEDSKIIDLYWARQESAIAESSSKYGRYCGAIAYHILQNPEDAGECVNDTWLRAWNAMPPHRPEKLSAFLGKITRNLALDLHKRLYADKRGGGRVELALDELEECIAGDNPLESAADTLVLTEAINAFLQGMPIEKRRIFVLRYWYLWSVREIAEHLQVSENKVTSVLFRARKELKRYLEKEEIVL